MSQFNVRESINIPYFDHDDSSLKKTIKNSSARRNISPLRFAVRKTRNILLARWSYACPLNSLRVKMNRKRGVNIGHNVYIGLHTTIDNAYPEYVYIEDDASVAEGVQIIAPSNPYPHFKNIVESSVAPIVIKRGAWIGSGAIILRGVTIGENAIVTAGAVIDKDVPACSIAQGNPMKLITEYSALM